MSAAHDRTLNVGDVAQVAIRSRVGGTLTDPAAVLVFVERPDGVKLNNSDHPTKVRVTVSGAGRFPLDILDDFDPAITSQENADGDGLILVEFVVGITGKLASDAARKWKVTYTGTGDARGGIDRTVNVRRPAVDFRFTASDDV